MAPTPVTAMTPVIAPASPNDFASKAVCLRLTVHRLGDHRKGNTDDIDHAIRTDRTRFQLGKRIVQSPQFQAITSLDYAIKRDLGKLTLPSLFKSGVYLTPVGVVEDVDRLLSHYLAQRAPLVAEFIARYTEHRADCPFGVVYDITTCTCDNIIGTDCRVLRDRFQQHEYPSAANVRAAFGVEYAFFAFASPTAIQDIKAELFAREANKARVWWEEAKQTGERALAEALGDMVASLGERLTGVNKNGKPKTLRTATVAALWEFLDTFDRRNLSESTELATAVEATRALLQGIETPSLRVAGDARSRVLDGLPAIQRALADLVVEKPSRQIILDDDVGDSSPQAPEPPAAADVPYRE